jgi:hypothetical protein
MKGTFDFSEALLFMRDGSRVTRAGWNAKGMFIYIVPGSEFHVNRRPLNEAYPVGTGLSYHAHIDQKTAQGDIVPWVATQTDLLADDWSFAEPGSNEA